MARAFSFGTGRDGASWPVLLLLATVLVPSGGVVWMMRQALESERLAARQRLADAYQAQLATAGERVVEQWQKRGAEIDEKIRMLTAAGAFSQCATRTLADSVLILDDAGQVQYPAVLLPTEAAAQPQIPAWRDAQQLEYGERNPVAAAQAYRQLAADSQDPKVAARARQAQARALEHAGDLAGAITALKMVADDNEAVDGQGRLLAADAELRLVELVGPESADAKEIITSLVKRANEYPSRSLGADQRRFLMRRLADLTAGKIVLPTLAAEELAAEYLAARGDLPATETLEPTPLADVWAVKTPAGDAIALYRTATLRRILQDSLPNVAVPADVRASVLSPSESSDTGASLATLPLGTRMPGWRLTLSAADGKFFEAEAKERVATIVWTAAALGAVTLALGWMAAATLQRQLQVARMKNDLVATVSHELKTPLASIRLLVDTLLERDDHAATSEERKQSRDYLELISQENARLTRLIDNFLTFSRLERGKQRFTFEDVPLAEVARQAVAAGGDRFDGSDAQLSVDVDEAASMRGDVDALVTVVVNLLDNAWKYTGPKKRVALTVRREGDRATISVADNGVGLSSRAARKVFDRFYQVDQRVARTQGGCGLGLSIVRSIVEAHGGEVSVTSRPGEGSTFVVSLPAVTAVTSHAEVGRDVQPADLRTDSSEDFGVTEVNAPKASKT